MAKRTAKKSAKAEPRDAPVGFRLGELQAQVQARQRGEAAPGAIVKRDLGRYYALLTDAKRTLFFSLSEAEALVLALSDFDVAAVRYIWAEIEKEYRQHADDEEGRFHYLPTDFDPVPFIDRLRRFSVCQNMALLDAVERYWVLERRRYPDTYPYPEVDDNLLVEVGLVSSGRKALDEEERKRVAERAAEDQRQLIVRDTDMLGRLRTKTSDDEPMSGYEPTEERG
jgi:hypothetical protein